MIPKSVQRFSEKIMLKQEAVRSHVLTQQRRPAPRCGNSPMSPSVWTDSCRMSARFHSK